MHKDSLVKSKLKAQVDKWEGLHRIAQSEDYKEYLKPILEGAFHNKWVDPASAETSEQFFKQYTEAYGRANAYKEIFTMLDQAGEMAINLAKQANNPDRDYGLGLKPTTN